MKKLEGVLAIVLAATLVCGIGVFAAETLDRSPTVTFDASTQKFEFANCDKYVDDIYPDLFSDMKNVMPGDTVSQTIKIKVNNAGSNTVKLYLKPVDASQQEDGLDAAPISDDYKKLCGGSHPATLSVRLNNNLNEVYDGVLIAITQNGSTTPVSDGVYLGAYNSQSNTGKITANLSLPIEAGNEYQGLTAKVGWAFLAEVIAPSIGPGDDETHIGDEDVPKAELNLTDHFAYIVGYPDGCVHPQSQITRAEVAMIFFRLMTEDSRNEFWKTTNSFTDVPSTKWFNDAISTLSNCGIVKGYPDGSFRPNSPITRGEFATISSRFYDAVYNGKDLFNDISESWSRDCINRAANAGIIKGYDDGSFRPQNNITREEAMTIMNRVLLRKPDEAHFLPDMHVWPDNVKGTWYYADVQEATNSHTYDMEIGENGKEDYEVWKEIFPTLELERPASVMTNVSAVSSVRLN